MSSNYWIKLYIEILNDPKMARLSDRLFRRTIELFLLAGAQGLDGLLPSLEDMAWQLRIFPQKLTAEMQALKEVDILDYSDGSWNVVNFKSRQSPVDTNERVKRHRDLKKQNQYHLTCNEDVTKRYTTSRNSSNETETIRYTDTDTDTETESNTESDTESEADTKAQEKQKAAAAVFKSYEREIGAITSTIADDIKSALDDYPAEWFERAFQESARQNKRSWKYALAILKRWKVEGFQVDKWKHSRDGNTRAYAGGSKPKGNDLETFRKLWEKEHEHDREAQEWCEDGTR